MTTQVDKVLRRADDAAARERLARLVVALVGVDTTVGPDLERVRSGEAKAFGLIADQIERIAGSRDGMLSVPIDPRIEADPYYTPAHYTASPEHPEPLSAAGTYRGRSNLVVRVPGQGRGTLAFNAHIDVVAPFFGPRREGEVVFGRGACDDKGQCAAMVYALELIKHAGAACGAVPPADLLFEFVIDEEPGGNGSLSLALDRRFAPDAMVVFEATKLAIHPGNRGAVWYRLALDGSAAPRLDLIGLAAAVVLGLEREGEALRAESDHPLFPHRPVQTCHGVLGPWGRHPSAVNDRVEFTVIFDGAPDPERLAMAVDHAVLAYCEVYGDKTAEPDPATGKPKVDHHYDLALQGASARLVVHGKAGHMGAVRECDGAITKTAWIVRALEECSELRTRGFELESGQPVAELVLEGGQGFLPTHSLAEVTERMRRAVADAARACCAERGVAWSPELATMTFDKLHNDAFARDASRPGVRAFVAAARGAGITVPEPLRGWDVSCDARIFAREYPESEIITFGAGALEHAHSDAEQVKVGDLAAAAGALARFALTYDPSTGEARGGG